MATLEDYLKDIIGNLALQVCVARTEVDKLQAENAALKEKASGGSS